MQTVYLWLAGNARILDDIDVDDVALELNDLGEVTDFRLELGRGYENLWLLPIEPNQRMRLVRVGYLTIDDMEPQLLADPCPVEFSNEWRGKLAEVGGGRVLEEVRLRMTGVAYRLEAVVPPTTYVLEYL